MRCGVSSLVLLSSAEKILLLSSELYCFKSLKMMVAVNIVLRQRHEPQITQLTIPNIPFSNSQACDLKLKSKSVTLP